MPDFIEKPEDDIEIFTIGTVKDIWLSVAKQMHKSFHPLESDRLATSSSSAQFSDFVFKRKFIRKTLKQNEA